MSNIKFVREIMESHPLAQAMVIEALSEYVEKVAALNPAEIEPNGLVNMKVWHQIACDIKEKIEEQYDK